ncbi:hypothetical protein HNR33_001208 [Brassicibacter mesophilus]
MLYNLIFTKGFEMKQDRGLFEYHKLECRNKT